MTIDRPDLSDLVTQLRGLGVERISLLMRHGAREYDRDNPAREPLLPLTEHGRSESRALGRRLLIPSVHFDSSPIPRCRETAQMVQQGCAERGAQISEHVVREHLGPFFLLDARPVIEMCIRRGAQAVFADWLEGATSPASLMAPDAAYQRLIDPLVEGLRAPAAPSLRVCVTHDANLYLARARSLDEGPRTHGPVGYLDGIALFEEGGEVFVASPKTRPRPLKR